MMQPNTLMADRELCEDEAIWDHLYQALKTTVKYWVSTHKPPSWVGQEDDVVEDIIQETILRAWNYQRKVEHGQVPPVKSLLRYCKTIALNYSKDLWRRDCRLVPSRDTYHVLIITMTEDPQEIAVERAWLQEVFLYVAHAIRKFPAKQQKALLTDLASRMDFCESSTPLQRAFLQVGIQLEDYQRPPSRDAGERNRYFSCLSTAYKKLKEVVLAYETTPEIGQGMKHEMLPRSNDILYSPAKMNAQVSMFLFVSSSLKVENMSSQATAKTVDTEQHEAFTQEMIPMDKSEKERIHDLGEEEQETSLILEDPELTLLALYLRRSVPPGIDSLYLETLQEKLLEMVLAQGQGKNYDEKEREARERMMQRGQQRSEVIPGQRKKALGDETGAVNHEDQRESVCFEFYLQHVQQQFEAQLKLRKKEFACYLEQLALEQLALQFETQLKLRERLCEIEFARKQEQSCDERERIRITSTPYKKQPLLEKDAALLEEADADTRNDQGAFEMFACCSQQTAPAVPIDPSFQDELQEKLLDTVRKTRPSDSTNKEKIQRALALKSGCPT